jgi:cell division protein FtsZ
MARRGDRASMREGPLAALFRKTDEGEPPEQPAAEPPKAEERPAAPPPPPERPARPHPSLSSEPAPAPQQEDERRIPTPQERLRHAFSSDIP